MHTGDTELLGSTNAKWLKTVDRNKRWPILWAIVRFKVWSFTLNSEQNNFACHFSKLPFGEFFSKHSIFFLYLSIFSLFYSQTKNCQDKFSIRCQLKKNALTFDWLRPFSYGGSVPLICVSVPIICTLCVCTLCTC